MNLDKYQEQAAEFDLFETTQDLNSPGFLEKILGLVGEAGETADKIKKIVRDKEGRLCSEDTMAIAKELGDVLWYVANVARYLGVSLDEVAKMNLKKLSSRKKRGKLHGTGDER